MMICLQSQPPSAIPSLWLSATMDRLIMTVSREWLSYERTTPQIAWLPLMLAICLKPDERLVGYISLANDPYRVSDGEAELGFRLAYDYWGRGIATEAAQAMVAHAICLQKTQRVVAIVDPKQPAISTRLAKDRHDDL